MVDYRELRVGNIIECFKYDVPVLSIGEKFVYMGKPILSPEIDSMGSSEYKFVNPLPLSEEILKEFGFISTGKEGEWINSKDGILIVKIDPSTRIISYTIGDMVFSNMWFVHQLQNLFYALTGHELVLEK